MRFRIIFLILIMVMAGVSLFGCGAANTEETPSSVVAPSEAPITDLTFTPTATPSPEPTATPTPTPEPTPEPADRKVAVADLMNYENVVNDYFGPVGDMDSERQKRVDYLQSFGVLSDDEAKTLVMYINLTALIPPKAYKRMDSEYFTLCNEKALKQTEASIEKIMKYNFSNGDDQIVISWLAVGDALNDCERANINEVQQLTFDMKGHDDLARVTAQSWFSRKGTIYSFFVDGKWIEVKADGNKDLSIVCKFFAVFIPYPSINQTYLNYKKNRTMSDIWFNAKYFTECMHQAMLKPEWIHRKTVGWTNGYYEGMEYEPETWEWWRTHSYINFKGDTGVRHKVGDSFVVQAIHGGDHVDDDEPFVWASSNEDVVKVDQDGNITCVGVGTAEISVSTWYGLSESFELSVVRFDFSENKKVVTVRDSFVLTVHIEGLDDDVYVEWFSDDDYSATVLRDGHTTVFKSGTVTITCVTDNGTLKDSFELTIVDKEE